VVAILALAGALYGSYRLGLQPVAATGAGRLFTVAAGQNAPAIARSLKAAGLIRDNTAFVTYVNFHGLRDELKTGTYLLAPTQSGTQIADQIAAGHTYTKRLLVPPGYTVSQIEFAASELGIPQAAFAAALAAPHAQSFLATKPAGVSLEGYLYPDSYEVDSTTTAGSLVNEMLTDFGTHVGQAYVTAFAAEGLTLHQGLTLASIVEKEVSNPTDQPIVAQIFIKRFKIGMPLGSDVTAQYAAGLLDVPFSTTVQSPYNTLLAPGLPPGPICSPGLGALDAVAHPATTDYLYFLTDKNGVAHYATTYAQHQANIAKYLN
jgi:peptidoglycan lytic transglycosylase G